MEHYAAIDVSLEWSSVCIVDPSGRIVREAKVRSEREAVVDFLQASGPYLRAHRPRRGTVVTVAAHGPRRGGVAGDLH
jgi:hypothetical protein